MTGQAGYILLGLLGSIVLGRLLSPSDFGIVGIAMFFIGVSNVLVESGMGGALIRKKDTTNEDYSTIFIFNLIVSLILTTLLILIAPYITSYYDNKDLYLVLISLSSILIINSFTITQNAKLVKDMKFKDRGIYKIISLIIATIIAFILAYFDFKYWSIIALQIISSFVYMIILQIRVGSFGNLVFSKSSFNEMYSFGLYTTLSSLLNTVFDNIYQLIIGKYFSLNQVGYYYQAKKLQEAPDTVSKLIILQVFYSHLSKLQEKLDAFKITYNLLAKITAILLGLFSVLVIIYSKELIVLILGEKWIEAEYYLKILMISGFFSLQEMVNRNIFKIFNQTHKILYLEIFKKFIQSISIFIGIYYKNLDYLLYGLIFTSVISYFINFYFSRKIVDGVSRYELINFLKIVLCGSLITLISVLLDSYLNIKDNYTILFFPVYILFYLLLLHIFNVQNILTLKKYKSFLKK